MLAARVQLPSQVEKTRFLKKCVFFFIFLQKMHLFHKARLSVQRGRRPLRVPLMMPLSIRIGLGAFSLCILHTFAFLLPVSMFYAQEGPRTSVFALFSEELLDVLVTGEDM